MTKLTSLLHRTASYSSVSWHSSDALPGVRFAIRRVSLRQRIELNHRVRELTIEHEFLKVGDVENQLQAALSELLAMRLYLEWGLAEIEGLHIDSQLATVATLIEKGPEALAIEIAKVIQAESSLTEEERKNS